MDTSHSKKIGSIIVLLSVSAFLVIISTKIPTAYYRDIFFYADAYVVHQISETGHIPSLITSEQGTLYWGKINNRIRLPVLPLILLVLFKITGVPVHDIYVTTPSFLLVGLSFYVIYRRLSLNQISSISMAIATGLALSATVYYGLSPVAFGGFLTYTGIFIYMVLKPKQNQLKPLSSVRIIFPVGAILFVQFYWYPPQFAKLALFIIITTIFAKLVSNAKARVASISLVVFSIFVSSQIISIPLPSYMFYLRSSVVNLSTFDFSLFSFIGTSTSSGSNMAAIQSNSYYSLYSLPLLLPLSLFGGIIAIRHTLFNEDRKNNLILFTATIWGVCSVLLAIPYFVSSDSWLAGRVFLIAQPVIFIGAAIGLQKLNRRSQVVYTTLLVLVVLLSAAGQAGTPQAQVQTYQPGIERGSLWTGQYTTGPIMTDMKAGAPLAANGVFRSQYPRSPSDVEQLFYTENYTRSIQSSNKYEFIIFYQEMTQSGFYPYSLPHEPITQKAYNIRTTNLCAVYSNGEVMTLMPDCRF